MNEPVRGLIVAHASLSSAMVATVEKICGDMGDALRPISNEGRNPERLQEAIRQQVGEGPVILFTDLGAGSCAFAARKMAQERPDTGFVCGLNVPMLVDFVFHREAAVDDLVPRLVEKGREGIFGTLATETDAGRTAAR